MLADKELCFLKKYFVKKATQRHLLSCDSVKTLTKTLPLPPSQKPVRGEGGGGGGGGEGDPIARIC